MGEEKEILLRGKVCAYLTDRLMGDPQGPPSRSSRNIWFTFENDRAGVLTTPLYGADLFLWASDYPHGATTWPDSQQIVDQQFEGVSEETKRKVTSQNAVDLYKLAL
jgi:hypothetical protein